MGTLRLTQTLHKVSYWVVVELHPKTRAVFFQDTWKMSHFPHTSLFPSLCFLSLTPQQSLLQSPCNSTPPSSIYAWVSIPYLREENLIWTLSTVTVTEDSVLYNKESLLLRHQERWNQLINSLEVPCSTWKVSMLGHTPLSLRIEGIRVTSEQVPSVGFALITHVLSNQSCSTWIFQVQNGRNFWQASELKEALVV